MANFNPFGFLQEVRNEGSKVTWPSRQTTVRYSALVVALCVVNVASWRLNEEARGGVAAASSDWAWCRDARLLCVMASPQ